MIQYLNSSNPKPGEICQSKNFGKFKIIGEIKEVFDETGLHPLNFKGRANKRFLVQFLDTGYMTYVSNSALVKGEVRDKLMPIVAGVGYLGANIKMTDPKYRHFYDCWSSMIARCYSVTDINYKDYGALGVSVDPKWFNFMNFYQDAQYLANYDKKLMFPFDYQLDKDILQSNIPVNQRIYSPTTCMFVSRFDNLQIRSKLLVKYNTGRYFGVEYPRTKYEGHVIKHPTYTVRVSSYENGKVITRGVACTTTAESAASLYNYIYPFLTRNLPHHDIMVLNKIENPIPYEELPNYIHMGPKTKNNWFNDYPEYTREYIASAMEAAGDRFMYICI